MALAHPKNYSSPQNCAKTPDLMMLMLTPDLLRSPLVTLAASAGSGLGPFSGTACPQEPFLLSQDGWAGRRRAAVRHPLWSGLLWEPPLPRLSHLPCTRYCLGQRFLWRTRAA